MAPAGHETDRQIDYEIEIDHEIETGRLDTTSALSSTASKSARLADLFCCRKASSFAESGSPALV